MRSLHFSSVVVLVASIGFASAGQAQLTPAGAQAWFQDDVPNQADESGARFGGALASGDFNADGYVDLVTSAPFASVPGTGRGGSTAVTDAGLVHVWYGSPSGVSDTNVTTLSRESLFGPGSTGDQFGQALAVGDFDGDQFDDLAIGAPGYDLTSAMDAGEVWVTYGSATGLSTSRRQQWVQTNSNIELSEANEQFGRSLVSGDFDADGRDDLAVGVPFEVDATLTAVGGVTVFYGAATVGLQSSGAQHWDWNNISALGTATQLLGWSLTSGNYNALEGDDLAISSLDGDAKVAILYGQSGTGLSVIDGNSVSNPDANTNFGIALATGDFNDDQRADLVVGQPGTASGGAANVYPGQPTVISPVDFATWDQNDTNQAVAESGDSYGSAIAAGDFDGNGFDDLAIGGPFEDLFPVGGGALIVDEGGVIVFLGSATGLTSTGSAFLSQELVLAPQEDDDRFGEVLVAGDFNGDGAADLAVGTPFEDASVIVDAGAVYIFYGQSPIFADGFESGDATAWSD